MVRLSPIAKYSRLQPSVDVWAVSQSHRCSSLGTPLPYQLADAPQAAQRADCSFSVATPSGITPPFGELYRTLRCVPVSYYLVCRLPCGPLDLHALSTPLAFTLS